MTMIEIRFGAENSRRHRMVWTCFKNIVNAKRIIKMKISFSKHKHCAQFQASKHFSAVSVFCVCILRPSSNDEVFCILPKFYTHRIILNETTVTTAIKPIAKWSNCMFGDTTTTKQRIKYVLLNRKNCPLKSCRLFDYNTFEHIKRLMDEFQ